LEAASVPENLINYEGAIHLFMQFHCTSAACRGAAEHCGAVLKRVLEG
jgi:hypothetical protein